MQSIEDWVAPLNLAGLSLHAALRHRSSMLCIEDWWPLYGRAIRHKTAYTYNQSYMHPQSSMLCIEDWWPRRSPCNQPYTHLKGGCV
jgi:hypothetical protein